MAAFFTQPNMRHPGMLGQNLMKVILVGERAYRVGAPEKHLRAVALWPTVPDVVDDRPAGVLE